MMPCTPNIDLNLCKGCGICIDMCPYKVLRLSDDVSSRGYHYPIVTGDCRGCRVCENYCPDFAISIVCGEDVEKSIGNR